MNKINKLHQEVLALKQRSIILSNYRGQFHTQAYSLFSYCIFSLFTLSLISAIFAVFVSFICCALGLVCLSSCFISDSCRCISIKFGIVIHAESCRCAYLYVSSNRTFVIFSRKNLILQKHWYILPNLDLIQFYKLVETQIQLLCEFNE